MKMVRPHDQRKISRTSLSTSSLTSSWNGQSESPYSSIMSSSPSMASPLSNASSGMVGITEERHVLFCGAKGCGKTSLIFTMGRGFFPPEDILPGRFEGWSISASATPMPTNTYGEGNSKKQKPYFFNLTMWEDRPRMNLYEKQLIEKRKKRQEEKQRMKAVETADDSNKSDANVFSNGLRIHYPTNSRNNKANGANQGSDVGVNFHSGPETGSKCGDSSDQSEDDSLDEIKVGQRPPLLSPDPDVLVLCYSVDSMEAYTAAEIEISPELKERYPGIPIILVANKADLSRDQQEQPADKSNCDEELEGVLTEGERNVGNLETKEDLEDDDGLWTMIDNLDSGFTNQLDSPASNFITSSMGNVLAKKIGARIFIECSAKDQQGLNRIIEEAVWALIVKNSNPLMAALMASAGSMSGNLSSSANANLPPIGPSRKISDIENNSSSWSSSFSSLLKSGSPLSTSWPRSAISGTSPTSGSGEKVKSRKSSTTSTGSQKSCPNIVTSSMSSRPIIYIEHPLSGSSMTSSSTSSPLAMATSSGRQRKTSYGAAVKKMWQNVNSKNKD